MKGQNLSTEGAGESFEGGVVSMGNGGSDCYFAIGRRKPRDSVSL